MNGRSAFELHKKAPEWFQKEFYNGYYHCWFDGSRYAIVRRIGHTIYSSGGASRYICAELFFVDKTNFSISNRIEGKLTDRLCEHISTLFVKNCEPSFSQEEVEATLKEMRQIERDLNRLENKERVSAIERQKLNREKEAKAYALAHRFKNDVWIGVNSVEDNNYRIEFRNVTPDQLKILEKVWNKMQS